MQNITKNNYILLAAKEYNSPLFLQKEFEEDMKNIKFIQRSIMKYDRTKKINERLVTNKIILLCNVIGNELTVRILFLMVGERYWSYLIPFFAYLSILPDVVFLVDGKNIITKDYVLDHRIEEMLRCM